MERPQLLSPRASKLLVVCAAIAQIVYLRILSSRGALPDVLFSDALDLAGGIRTFSHGQSPYSLLSFPLFVYPPIFALAGSWLAKLFTPSLGWILYLSAHVASVVAIPIVLARIYFRPMRVMEAVALYLLGPLAFIEMALLFGNVAGLCYCLAYFAAGDGIVHRRWRWFYLVVVLASAIKITFLVLLLLPLLVDTGQILPSAVVSAVTGAIYSLQRIFAPNLYRDFRRALSSQTFNGRDYGDGIFGATANLMKRFHSFGFVIPAAVYLLFIAAIVITLFWLRRRVSRKAPEWFALVIVAIALANPRLMNYDVLPALIPAWYLLISTIHRPLTRLLIVVSMAGFFIGHGPIGFVFLFTSAFIVGVRTCANHGNKDVQEEAGNVSFAGFAPR